MIAGLSKEAKNAREEEATRRGGESELLRAAQAGGPATAKAPMSVSATSRGGTKATAVANPALAPTATAPAPAAASAAATSPPSAAAAAPRPAPKSQYAAEGELILRGFAPAPPPPDAPIHAVPARAGENTAIRAVAASASQPMAVAGQAAREKAREEFQAQIPKRVYDNRQALADDRARAAARVKETDLPHMLARPSTSDSALFAPPTAHGHPAVTNARNGMVMAMESLPKQHAPAAHAAPAAPRAGFGVTPARLVAGGIALGGAAALYRAFNPPASQPAAPTGQPMVPKQAAQSMPAAPRKTLPHLTPFDMALTGIGSAALTGAVLKMRYDKALENERRDSDAMRRREMAAQNRLVRQVSRIQGG